MSNQQFLAFALDRRSREYLAAFFLGMILSSGRRTVSSWFRAVGVGDDWQDHYFLQTLSRRAAKVSTWLLLLALRGFRGATSWITPGWPSTIPPPNVTGRASKGPARRSRFASACGGITTPRPGRAAFLYGLVWVTLSWLVRRPLWGCIGCSPLRVLMYVRRTDLEAMERADEAPWSFRTKLELAAELVEWCVKIFRDYLEKPVIVAVDGAYAKREFLNRSQAAGAMGARRGLR